MSRVLLVGWDSADWKIVQPLLDRGELPVLQRLIEGGVMGDLASLRPMISPMLWTSIATGKRPYQHGVCGFTEVDYEMNTVVPVSASTRKCRAVWDILNEAGLRTHVIGWFATHPAEPINGVSVSDRFASPAPNPGEPWPLTRGTVHPASLADTLSELRIRPEEIPADILHLFVPRAAEVDQENDKRLHELAQHLAESFSVHAAATYALEHEPWDFAAVYYRAIDWLCHHFMEFHAPRRQHVPERDFEIYHDVVNGAYRLHDLMLGRLLQLAGDDCTVLLVSDHGFKSGSDRPMETPNVPLGITVWHRSHGVLAMRGEKLRGDELIHGASILDITPTILSLFNLPIASDMDGRVLAEAFAETPALTHRDTYEDTPFQRVRVRSASDRELLKQFADIGYIDDAAQNSDENIRVTSREENWALAQSYLDAGKLADALQLLENIFAQWPTRGDYCIELALCQMNLGLLDEAEATLDTLAPERRRAGMFVLRANIALARRNHANVREILRTLENDAALSANLQHQLGVLKLRLHDIAGAEKSFRNAAANDPDDASAHLGLARSHLLARRYEEAADSALRALALRFHLAHAHLLLGIALARLGESARAIQAFETCLRYQPAEIRAHRYLACLWRRLGKMERAEFHRVYLRGATERRKAATAYVAQLRRDAAQRARERAAARAKESPLPKVISTDDPAQEFLLVSGLPRSGTSLMMQMLAAAGVPIMTDAQRAPDESNERGYFEWEEIKKLPQQTRIMEKANGRAVKVISMLLPSLPRRHRFRIIFMNRDLAAVAASQEKLRARLTPGSVNDRNAIIERLGEHRTRILDMVQQAPTVEVLQVDYDALLQNPRAFVDDVVKFARLDPTLADAMCAVVEPQLCHETASTLAL